MSGRVYELRCAKLWLDEDDIVREVFLPGSEIILSDAEEILSVYRSLKPGRKFLVYMDTRGVKSVGRDVRNFVKENFDSYILAIAATGTPIVRVLSELFNKLNKPPYPTKFFAVEKDALNWLKELSKESNQ
jgi:hypothetical protein